MTESRLRTLVMSIGLSALMGSAAVLERATPALATPDSKVWGQDPFGAPPGAVDESGGGAQPMAPAELQGIIAGPGGMVAIIDDRIVRIGDRVGAELVVEITPRAVVLRRGLTVRRLAISVVPTHGH